MNTKGTESILLLTGSKHPPEKILSVHKQTETEQVLLSDLSDIVRLNFTIFPAFVPIPK